jgi:hypothetical protein|tara:strand:+ start:185 stop:499 length:315 start_codon:yes stop_codon:yes gene_type:complete
MKEGEDFVLEDEANPGEGEMEFNVRFMKGEFVETLIGFKNLRIVDDPNIEDDDEFALSYDFAIKSSPDPDLNEQNKGLQTLAGDVLYALMSDAQKVKEEDIPRG